MNETMKFMAVVRHGSTANSVLQLARLSLIFVVILFRQNSHILRENHIQAARRLVVTRKDKRKAPDCIGTEAGFLRKRRRMVNMAGNAESVPDNQIVQKARELWGASHDKEKEFQLGKIKTSRNLSNDKHPNL